MTPLRYIVEPEKLTMTWMPSDESGKLRMRRAVAEIYRDCDEPDLWHFRYLHGTREMDDAIAAGFLGHPAFKRSVEKHSLGVRETLLRRLPSRQREDFAEFLAMHRLPVPFNASDMALIGYTGAKLPSDGFAFVPVFPSTSEPCEYILEVAGMRHVYKGHVDSIRVGDYVEFAKEPTNSFDADAIQIRHNNMHLGYVNRAFLHCFNAWLERGDVVGWIERKNGTADRPLIYVRVAVGCSTATA